MADLTIRQRLKQRQNQLRETRAILAKRDATVRRRKRQQRHARKNLEHAVKYHKPLHTIDTLQRKLTEAHVLLDKAILGQKGYEKRERELEKKVKWLKDHVPEPAPSAQGVSTPTASWNPNRRQISNSLIPWLEKSHRAGWRGYVTSGYRSPAYQCQICASMCPGGCANGCPGRCARPGQSNHGRYGPHDGAVDVTDYYNFKSIQYRIGSPLRNYLGAADPVHFSFTGS